MHTLELELESGNRIFVEVAPSSTHGRAEEVADGPTSAKFSKVAASISSVVKSVEEQLRKLPSRPDAFQVEIGAEIKGEADLWLVAGEAKGHIKITMRWENT